MVQRPVVCIDSNHSFDTTFGFEIMSLYTSIDTPALSIALVTVDHSGESGLAGDVG